MILVRVLSLCVLVTAANPKPVIKKTGLAATPKQTAVNPKVAVAKTKAPVRKAPVKSVPQTKKLVANKTAVPKKPAAPKQAAPAKKPAAKETVLNKTPAKKTPIKATPIRKAKAQVGEIARTKSRLEAAMAYMKAQSPLEKSGDRKIEDLLASPSEAQVVEPFDPEKFFQARSDKINENKNNSNRSKAQTSAAHQSNLPSLLVIASVAILLI